MRTANSLDSLDCVTSSIQQARASSAQRAGEGQDQFPASPQLLRINRSNSMRSVEIFLSHYFPQSLQDNFFLVINLLAVEMID